MLRIYPSVSFDLEAEEARWFESLNTLKSLQLVDAEYYINKALDNEKRILAEGAQGSMLDIDFGTYPFVTSSNTVTAGVCVGLGVAPSRIGEVIGVTKAYCTRVGSGPFPTELHDSVGDLLRTEGAEFGSTTGRPRRCGWIDLPQLRYTIMLNGVTQLCITKIDVLNVFAELKAATAYRYGGVESADLPYDMTGTSVKPVYQKFAGWKQALDGIQALEALPDALKQYVLFLEKALDVPITMISTGPEREKLILIPKLEPLPY
jgi:adenylosuccinate synthase